MEIKINESGKGYVLAGFSNVEYNGLNLNNLSLIEKDGERFLGFPSKLSDDKYYKMYWIPDEELKDNLFQYLNEVYENKINGTPITTALIKNNDIKDIKIYETEKKSWSDVEAFVSLTFHGVRLSGITLHEEGQIKCPEFSPKNKDGEYYKTQEGKRYSIPYFRPLSSEGYKQIESAIQEEKKIMKMREYEIDEDDLKEAFKIIDSAVGKTPAREQMKKEILNQVDKHNKIASGKVTEDTRSSQNVKFLHEQIEKIFETAEGISLEIKIDER